MPSKNILHPNDSTLNIFSLITGLFVFTSPFLSFISVNVLESVFNKTLFLKFSLMAITTIVVLIVPSAFIASRFLFRTAFYRLFPIFYAGFLSLFLYIPFRHLLLSLGAPVVVRFIYAPFVLFILWIIFRLSKFKKFHLVALVSAMSLIAAPLLVLIQKSAPILFDHSTISSVDYKKDWGDKISNNTVNSVDQPNIYFVVPDGYTSVAALRDKLSFDNHPFIQKMEKRGFVHLPDSFSSYANTHLTLCSLLQANYPVTEDSSLYKSREDFYPSLLYKVEPFQVAKAVRHLGYTASIVGNSWADCAGPHVSCYQDQRKWISSEILSFFEMTPLPRLLRRNKQRELPSDASGGIDAVARAIKYLRSDDRMKMPYFMLIHDLTTHEHFFDADCRVHSDVEMEGIKPNDERAKQFYLDSLQCSNKKLIEFADYIADSDPTALIVIQADHGIAFSMINSSGLAIPFKDLPENAIRERMSVLSLVRVPDKCRKWLRSDLNTVNTVRFIFACATETEPEYLENKSYMSFSEENSSFGLVYRVK